MPPATESDHGFDGIVCTGGVGCRRAPRLMVEHISAIEEITTSQRTRSTKKTIDVESAILSKCAADLCRLSDRRL